MRLRRRHGIFLCACLVLAAARAQDRPIVLAGGAVVDGTGAPRAEGISVRIERGRITAVGPEVARDGADVIDVAGRTLIPGLFDMHGHYYGNVGGRIADLFEPYARLYLAGGVTTTFSPGDHDPEGMVAFRERVRKGEVPGPRILTAGPYLDHAPSAISWIEGVADADAAVAKLRAWQDRIDGVKVYTRITEEQLAAVIAAAHAARLRVTGHLGSVTAARAIELGIDRLEHGLFAMTEFGQQRDPNDLGWYERLAALDLEGPEVRRLIEAIVARKVALDPTIVIFEASQGRLDPVTPDVAKYLAAEVVARWERLDRARAAMVARQGAAWGKAVDGALQKAREFAVAVHRAGGIVVAGTDPVAVRVLPGWGLHAELRNFVRGGMRPLEALRCASHGAALALGLEQELGTIAPGRRADIVVVDGDPSAELAALARIVLVFRDGVVFDPAELRRGVEGAIR